MTTDSHRILITGHPGSGKTTLIKRVAAKVDNRPRGFFTSEIRRKSVRVGFEIETFAGAKAIMAHVDTDSPYRVSKYGVDVAAFEKIALPELEAAIADKRPLVIDEIGKMELFSERFKELITAIFNSDLPLVATIMEKPHPFCDRLKKIPSTKLITITRDNFARTEDEVSAWLDEARSK